MADNQFTFCRASLPSRCFGHKGANYQICRASLSYSEHYPHSKTPEEVLTEAILANATYTQVITITCKFCGSKNVVKFGTRHGVQQYLCRHCGRKFMEKDTPERKQSSTKEIGYALGAFYDGLSVADISHHLEATFHNSVNPSTVYRWIMEYSQKAIKLLEQHKANVSDIWVVDETVIQVAGNNFWLFDVIDEDTRFLIDTHLARSRTIADVVALFEDCKKRTTQGPKFILSDKLAAYIDGIERVFGAEATHIQSQGMTSDININLIERFHNTLKERTKVMRGFKTRETAQIILDGFVVHYNFFRPHTSLADKPPAEVAGIKLPFKTWEDYVRSTYT